MPTKLNTPWSVRPHDWSGLWTTFIEGNYFAREWIEEVHHQKLAGIGQAARDAHGLRHHRRVHHRPIRNVWA